MAFQYKNPISDSQLNTVETVSRLKTYGTNFSVLQVGGYMEVYTLNDLSFTIPDGATGPIEFTGNTIPVNYSKRTLPFLPDTLTLNSDNISSGRRRLGMLVYVHETSQTYQFSIDDYETLWDNASESTSQTDYGTTITTSTSGGEDFINAWLNSSIEGVSGVTRENARWRIFWGTDWQITGGTYNSGTGTLSLDNNTGGTINVTGFTSGGGSQTLQQVLDTGNVSTTGMYISGATLTATTVDINGGYIDGVVLGSVSPVTLTSNSATITGGYLNGVVLGNTTPVTITSNNATITGGYLNGVVLGNVTPVTITSNNATITSGYLNGVVLGNTTPVTITSNNATITSGNINGTNIGLTTRGPAGFTYIYDNNGLTGNTGQILSTSTTGITWIDSSSTDYYVTGGTYNSGTTTLTLSRNDGNTVDVTGFTSGGGGSLTLQDVTDNGSTTTRAISVRSVTSEFDLTINEGITAGNGGGDISSNTVFGASALANNSSGNGNSAFGTWTLSATTGSGNSAFGSLALYKNTTGNNNTAIGKNAMYNGTTSLENVAVGSEAFYNGGGSIGVAIGYQAGYEVTTASGSILIGYRAGYDITDNSRNIAIGYESLRFNDEGTFNVAVGDTALHGNRSGNFNVAIGNDALVSNTTGLRNVGVGADSLSTNQTGSDNVAIGFEAGQNIDGGGLNGIANDSIFIGKGSKASVNNGSNEIVIGTDAIGNGSNTITLGNTGHTDTYLFGTIHGVPYLTGGTLINDTLTLVDVDGGSFDITGFTSTSSDTYVTGGTYTESTGILSLGRNDGQNVGIGGFSYVKSLTVNNNNLTITPNIGSPALAQVNAITDLGYNDWGLSGTSTGVFYSGTELPFITGGTYSSGTITLGINGGLESDITISGLDSDDTYLTGATYSPTTLTLGMNDGTDFTVSGFAPEITGGTYNNGTLSLEDNTGGSVDISGITFSSTNIYSNDGQLTANRIVDQNSNTLTFSGGSVSMGTDTTSPVCAILELASTTQGLLIPRMTQVERLAINTPLPGLLVYCTNSDGNGAEGMYMYKSSGWVNVL
jgi:hypothetical protein